MFLKVYFLNFRYFFIVKKQQLVLCSYITYREIENNQPGSGAFARFPHPHPGEFTKKMLMPGGQPGGGGGGWALLELTDALPIPRPDNLEESLFPPVPSLAMTTFRTVQECILDVNT